MRFLLKLTRRFQKPGTLLATLILGLIWSNALGQCPTDNLVENPQESMHDIFMGKPRHKFHDTESGQKDSDPEECLHNLYQI